MKKHLLRYLMISAITCLFGAQALAYYEPETGRFISADPAGEEENPNLYQAFNGDPINHVDPDGRQSVNIASDLGMHNPEEFVRDGLARLQGAGSTEQMRGQMFGDVMMIAWVGEGVSFLIPVGLAYAPASASIFNTLTVASFNRYVQGAVLGGGFMFLETVHRGGSPSEVAVNTAGGAAGGVTVTYIASGAPGVIQAIKSIPRINLMPTLNQAIATWRMTRPLGNTSGSVINPFAPEEAALKPYGGPGGGHHVPAKSAFSGAPGYNANTALAIPNDEMVRLGIQHLELVTPAQRALYTAFSKTGGTLTWSIMEKIEAEALIRGGMESGMARATVQRAIQALKASGVTGPTRIPWAAK